MSTVNLQVDSFLVLSCHRLFFVGSRLVFLGVCLCSLKCQCACGLWFIKEGRTPEDVEHDRLCGVVEQVWGFGGGSSTGPATSCQEQPNLRAREFSRLRRRGSGFRVFKFKHFDSRMTLLFAGSLAPPPGVGGAPHNLLTLSRNPLTCSRNP